MIVDILILALLEKRPRHGYEIKKKSSDIFVNELALNNNLLYPALRRLEISGAIERDSDGAASALSRRVYRITDRGRVILDELIADFDGVKAGNPNEFLTRLAFFDLIDAPTRERIVRERLRALERAKARLEGQKDLVARSSIWVQRIFTRRLQERNADIEWTEGLLGPSASADGKGTLE